MLFSYLTTVAIWMIIIYCIMILFKTGIRDKMDKFSEELNVEESKKTATKAKALGALFVMSAVPVLRFFIAIGIPYMATCSDEQFEKIVSKGKAAYDEQ